MPSLSFHVLSSPDTLGAVNSLRHSSVGPLTVPPPVIRYHNLAYPPFPQRVFDSLKWINQAKLTKLDWNFLIQPLIPSPFWMFHA